MFGKSFVHIKVWCFTEIGIKINEDIENGISKVEKKINELENTFYNNAILDVNSVVRIMSCIDYPTRSFIYTFDGDSFIMDGTPTQILENFERQLSDYKKVNLN